MQVTLSKTPTLLKVDAEARLLRLYAFLDALVAYLKEQVNKKGLSALNSALDFDEFQVLVTNAQYLRNTLQVI